MTHNLEVILQNHCDSVGKDSHGLTDCRRCPVNVRCECYENGRPTPQGHEAIESHKLRILNAILEIER